MNVKAILDDWRNNGLTHGEIKEKYGLSHEVEFAITEMSRGLSEEEIEGKLTQIKEGMKSTEIKTIMQG